jgi:hypothetical protein
VVHRRHRHRAVRAQPGRQAASHPPSPSARRRNGSRRGWLGSRKQGIARRRAQPASPPSRAPRAPRNARSLGETRAGAIPDLRSRAPPVVLAPLARN